MKQTRGEKVYAVFNYILLTCIALLTIYPFIYIISASISSSDAVISGKVLLFPHHLTLVSYERVLSEKGIWIAYGNTLYYTIAGTLVNVLFTILGAYPLSKKRLTGRTFLGVFIGFTLLFQAGMIPVFLNISSLHLLNTRTAIIIAFAVSTWLVIVLRTFFQSIPEELEEAAVMDGASDWAILWKIYLPLSKASLAAIALFYAVSRWNSYFWPMILINDTNKVPLQVLLKKLIIQMQPTAEMMQKADVQNYSVETVVYATIFISILPVLIVYPFIQKYFVKGIMIGSLKG
jgi:putative aldouronate transport system permease protein